MKRKKVERRLRSPLKRESERALRDRKFNRRRSSIRRTYGAIVDHARADARLRRPDLNPPPRLGGRPDGGFRGRPVSAGPVGRGGSSRGARSRRSPGRGRTPRVAAGRRRDAGAELREDLVDHRRLRDEGDESHEAVAAGSRQGVDFNDQSAIVRGMSSPMEQPKNPLLGVTLERVVTELVEWIRSRQCISI